MLTNGDVSDLIHGSITIGYLYARKIEEFRPDHLSFDQSSVLKRLHSGKPKDVQKLNRRMGALFKERRIISTHMFYNESKWHLLFFSTEDRTKENNHWASGAHIHFVNFLWPQYDRDKLWRDITKERWTTIPGSFHIPCRTIE
jgi:hypothetical protein